MAASMLDGLLLGSGDAVIGASTPRVTPQLSRCVWLHAIDTLRLRFQIPTQLVLAHITTQMAALESVGPIDLIFQSIAGTEMANRSFGVGLLLLDEAYEAGRTLARGARCSDGNVGSNLMYFETGQGSRCRPNPTMEWTSRRLRRAPMPSRVHSRHCWSIRSSDSSALNICMTANRSLRAALEDHFCGKLLGLPMGWISATPTTVKQIRTIWIPC